MRSPQPFPRIVKTMAKLADTPDVHIFLNVPLEDLSPAGRERPEIDSSLELLRLRYVLCRGTCVLLSVTDWNTFGRWGRKSSRLDESSVPGLLIVKDTQTLHYTEIVRDKLKDREENPPELDWRYCPHPISKRDQERFCRKRLIEPQKPEELPQADGELYRLTDYGREMGLTTGYHLHEGTLRCALICSKDRTAALKEPWPWAGEMGGRLVRRLEQSGPGGPGRGAITAACRLAGIPLAEYMEEFPRELNRLLTGLELGPLCTFREAAGGIARMLDNRRYGQKPGRAMLRCLSAAMELAYQSKRSRILAVRETVLELFRGFGVMSGEGWPEWAARRLMNDYPVFDSPEDYTCGSLVHYVWSRLPGLEDRMERTGRELEDVDPSRYAVCEDDFEDVAALKRQAREDALYDILYRLLIAPMVFLEMNESV